MYSHEIKPHLKKVLEKLSKKDKSMYEQILQKIDEIIKSDNGAAGGMIKFRYWHY